MSKADFFFIFFRLYAFQYYTMASAPPPYVQDGAEHMIGKRWSENRSSGHPSLTPSRLTVMDWKRFVDE